MSKKGAWFFGPDSACDPPTSSEESSDEEEGSQCEEEELQCEELEPNGRHGEETSCFVAQEVCEQCPSEAEVPVEGHYDGTVVYSMSVVTGDDISGPIAAEILPPTDIWYTGMMYHEQKGTGYWKTTYTVVRDLEVLKEYLREECAHAEREGIDVFKFVKPNGSLHLSFKDNQQQTGWTVTPHREPMEIYRSTVDKFPRDPMCSSCSYSIYARIDEPGAAKEPLHCPIQLTGIVPSRVIYITRSLPVIPQTVTVPTSDRVSSSRQVESGGSFRADIAHQVICSNFGLIKESRIRLHSLANKLLENEFINEGERKEVTDEHGGLTADQRMDKLLKFVAACIQEDGDDFKLFLDILRQENTRRADRLADKLLEQYRNY